MVTYTSNFSLKNEPAVYLCTESAGQVSLHCNTCGVHWSPWARATAVDDDDANCENDEKTLSTWFIACPAVGKNGQVLVELGPTGVLCMLNTTWFVRHVMKLTILRWYNTCRVSLLFEWVYCRKAVVSCAIKWLKYCAKINVFIKIFYFIAAHITL